MLYHWYLIRWSRSYETAFVLSLSANVCVRKELLLSIHLFSLSGITESDQREAAILIEKKLLRTIHYCTVSTIRIVNNN